MALSFTNIWLSFIFTLCMILKKQSKVYPLMWNNVYNDVPDFEVLDDVSKLKFLLWKTHFT